MEMQIEEKKPTVTASNDAVETGDEDSMNESAFQDLRKRVLKASGIAEVCMHRLRLLTESYKETEAEPMMIRRAKAFRKILTEIPVTIENWQKVVGNYAGKPLKTSIYPEYTAAWILDEMEDLAIREGDKFILTEADKIFLKETIPYWQGKTVEDAVDNMVPDSVREAEKNALISSAIKNEGIGQFLPDYEIVLHKGINGVIADLIKAKDNSDPTQGDYLKRTLFYDAALICCKAVIDHSQRFSKHAGELAGAETDEVRRNELLRISQICESVPANPAGTFLEALQSFWFTHLLMYVEAGGQGITMGRFDQYMYPYYKKDLESGRLTRETAKEWLKI
jgi:formate C-acetyltransferase